MKCDPETGLCRVPESSVRPTPSTPNGSAAATVRYVGDPMCSWCWGMSAELEKVALYCKSHGLGFSVHVGGLRPGGGDPWNAQFKAFLRHEWEQIHRVTGQPFDFTLLDTADFNYDTEPACRAVAVMAGLLEARGDDRMAVLTFFAGIQRRFYVGGADPKQAEFYRDLCPGVGVSYEDFLAAFLSVASRTRTIQEFQRCRSWGVRGFPSVLLDMKDRLIPLASGYTTSTALIESISTLLRDSTPSD